MTTLEAGVCTLCGIGGAGLAVLFWIGDSLFSIKLSLDRPSRPPTPTPQNHGGNDGA